jgi:dTDP-glucose 4,6-dehydratase
MRILVAGGAGMVGSHLVDALIAGGHHVIVLDNFATGSPQNLAHLVGHDRLELVRADIVQPLEEIDRSLGSIDQIVHLASPASPVAYSRDPVATLMVNAQGTRRLLDLALAHRARFVLASTSEVYGDPKVTPQPESYWGNVNPIGPRACYDEGERFRESLVMTYGRVHGLDVRIARIFIHTGHDQRSTMGGSSPTFVCRPSEENRSRSTVMDARPARSATSTISSVVSLP